MTKPLPHDCQIPSSSVAISASSLQKQNKPKYRIVKRYSILLTEYEFRLQERFLGLWFTFETSSWIDTLETKLVQRLKSKPVRVKQETFKAYYAEDGTKLEDDSTVVGIAPNGKLLLKSCCDYR